MFKISDEDIMSFVKKSLREESEKKGLLTESEVGNSDQSNQNALLKGCEKIPRYPRLPLNKLVGKRQNSNLEARQFRDIIESIELTSNTVKGRIIELQNKLSEAMMVSQNKSLDLNEVLSRFVFLDTMISLVNVDAYEPQMAGLLLEPLIAGVLRGEQEGGTKVISDIRLPNLENRGVSLKLKDDFKAGGSYILYLQELVRAKGQIDFLLVNKGSAPKGPLPSTRLLNFRFFSPSPVDGAALQEAIIFDLKTSHYLMGAGQILSDLKSINKEGGQISGEVQQDMSILSKALGPGTEISRRAFVEQLVATRTRLEDLVKLRKDPTISDLILGNKYIRRAFSSKLSETYKLLSDAGFTHGSGIKTDREGKNGEKFIISIDMKKYILSDDGGVESSSLDLPSTEKLEDIAENLLKEMEDGLTHIYSSIGELSCIMRNYIANPKIDRADFAQEAKKRAATIKYRSNKIIKDKEN
tara:strand:- start:614 stop:2023 length:1410 start_codon:yes stop_codon:yes gene_type:complete